MALWFLAAKVFLARRDEGASIVEYALLISLLAVVCLVAITTLGSSLSSMFSAAATSI